MAKGVDLTSQEWRDIVFEGKNKEFGAYQLRKKSPKRHYFAIIGIIILLIAVAILVFSWNKYQEIKEAEALAKGAQMSEVMFEQEAQEEQQEEEEVKYEEQPEPEQQVEEEQVASQQVTTIAIVDKPDADKEVKNMDQIQENQAQVGNINQEGKIDITEVQQKTAAVTVVEKVEPKPEPIVEKKNEPEKIFEAVEQPAEFPGGMAALNKWLNNNLRYPEAAQENGIQGRVVVKFTVEKDGSISNPTIVRGVDKDLDREAIRVVKKMPKWKAGKNNGVAVRSYFNLPVNFKIQQ